MWLCLSLLQTVLSSQFVFAEQTYDHVKHDLKFVEDNNLEYYIKKMVWFFEDISDIAHRNNTQPYMLLGEISKLEKRLKPVSSLFEKQLTNNEMSFLLSVYRKLKQFQIHQQTVFNYNGSAEGREQTLNTFKKNYTESKMKPKVIYTRIFRLLRNKSTIRKYFLQPLIYWMPLKNDSGVKERRAYFRGLVELVSRLTGLRLMMTIINNNHSTLPSGKIFDIVKDSIKLFRPLSNVLIETKMQLQILTLYYERPVCVIAASVISLFTLKYPDYKFGMVSYNSPFDTKNRFIKSIRCERGIVRIGKAYDKIMIKSIIATQVDMEKIQDDMKKKLNSSVTSQEQMMSEFIRIFRNDICFNNILAYLIPLDFNQCVQTSKLMKVAKYNFEIIECNDEICDSRPYLLYLIG